VLQVVNSTGAPATSSVHIDGLPVGRGTVEVRTLAADPTAANSADQPTLVQPTATSAFADAKCTEDQHTFPPHSLTVVRWQWADGPHP